MKRIKKLISYVLCLSLVVGLCSGLQLKVYAFGRENLADADIASNTTYFFRSAQKNLTVMPTNSRPGWVYVSLFDNTNTDSQKWNITKNGDNYIIKNAGTGYTLHYGEGVKDAHVDQNGYDGTDFYKWKIKKVTSGDYNGGYMLEAVRKDSNGQPVYATAANNNRGEELYLRSLDTDHPERQVFYFDQTNNVDSNEVTLTKANVIGQGYLDKYYVDTQQSNGSTRKSLGGGFWVGAELCEMMLDGYEAYGETRYRDAFLNCYQDELDNIANRYTYWTGMTEEDWRDNPFNDDIMWLVLASVRAYLLIGNGGSGYTDYLKYAKNNFQTVINRGTKADGSIQWSHESGRGDGSNSCINGPTTVAACYLARATGDDSYYEKAKSIHAAQRRLMVNTDTGRVLDTATNDWASCYNQGTWIGACVMLYLRYHEQEYLEDAIKAVNFVINKNGYFSDEYGILKTENQTDGDLAAFRSILMRYLRMFIVEMAPYTNTDDCLKWMQKNGTVIYNNRNAYNVIHNPFQNAMPNDKDYGSTGMAGGVSLMLNIPKFGAQTVKRDAFERIEAEDFDYVYKAMTEGTGDNQGGASQVAGTQNGYYTGYANVNFGSEGATKATFRFATISDSAKIEIRLGSKDGQVIGTANLPNTNGWGNFQTMTCDIAKTTGNQKVYLIYTGNGYLVNLNWFQFAKEQQQETTTTRVEATTRVEETTKQSGQDGKQNPNNSAVNDASLKSATAIGSAVTEAVGKYKVIVAQGNAEVVNIQEPGFATAPGAYVTFNDADFGDMTVNGVALSKDVQGAGVIVHLSNFDYQYSEVVVKSGDGSTKAILHVYYEDGIDNVTGEKTTTTAVVTTKSEEVTTKKEENTTRKEENTTKKEETTTKKPEETTKNTSYNPGFNPADLTYTEVACTGDDSKTPLGFAATSDSNIEGMNPWYGDGGNTFMLQYADPNAEGVMATVTVNGEAPASGMITEKAQGLVKINPNTLPDDSYTTVTVTLDSGKKATFVVKKGNPTDKPSETTKKEETTDADVTTKVSEETTTTAGNTDVTTAGNTDVTTPGGIEITTANTETSTTREINTTTREINTTTKQGGQITTTKNTETTTVDRTTTKSNDVTTPDGQTTAQNSTETTAANQDGDAVTTVALSEKAVVNAKVGKTKVKKATKKAAAKKIKVSLKKISTAAGYQVRVFKAKKDAKKNKKAIVKKTIKKASATIKSKKLANKAKLFVRARAYKLIGGAKKFGKWSAVKKAKIK